LPALRQALARLPLVGYQAETFAGCRMVGSGPDCGTADAMRQHTL
jgi:hypothetical protein